MELKLNIYEKRKVIKTYTTETYDIMFGTVEDLINVIDLDSFTKDDDDDFIKAIGKIIVNSMDIIKPLLKDIFEGLTDEELRKTKISEIVKNVIEIVKFSIAQMGKGGNEKN